MSTKPKIAAPNDRNKRPKGRTPFIIAAIALIAIAYKLFSNNWNYIALFP
jgi:hypothetical protein